MQEIEYNRNSVLSYAKQWALSRNPQYYDFAEVGGDCTSFASQCVFAGCGVMNYTPIYGWYYITGNDKSPSWSGVNYFYDFITSNEGVGPYGIATEWYNLLPGDIIQLGTSSGKFYHTLVLTGIQTNRRGTRFYVSAHNNDAYMRPLDSYSYGAIRYIHIIGARKDNEISPDMENISI